MIYGVYAVKDRLTGFLPPTYDYSDGSAIRNFKFAVNNADSLFFKSPEDYSLYKIGNYNSDTGKIEAYVDLDFLIGARDCKEE